MVVRLVDPERSMLLKSPAWILFSQWHKVQVWVFLTGGRVSRDADLLPAEQTTRENISELTDATTAASNASEGSPACRYTVSNGLGVNHVGCKSFSFWISAPEVKTAEPETTLTPSPGNLLFFSFLHIQTSRWWRHWGCQLDKWPPLPSTKHSH